MIVLAQPNARKIDETRMRISEDERVARAAQLQRTMQLLVHASECRDPHCASSNCRKIKEMFAHAHSCRVKVTGGCQLCRCGSMSNLFRIAEQVLAVGSKLPAHSCHLPAASSTGQRLTANLKLCASAFIRQGGASGVRISVLPQHQAAGIADAKALPRQHSDDQRFLCVLQTHVGAAAAARKAVHSGGLPGAAVPGTAAHAAAADGAPGGEAARRLQEHAAQPGTVT